MIALSADLSNVENQVMFNYLAKNEIKNITNTIEV